MTITKPSTISTPSTGATGWDVSATNPLITACNNAIQQMCDVMNDNRTPNEIINNILANTAHLAAGTGITLTNDVAPPNTAKVTIACSITQYTDEMAQDAVAAALVGGTGMTVTYNDAANTITLATTITQYTDENAQDAVAAALTQGPGIAIVYNDAANTITISRIKVVTITLSGGAVTPNCGTTDLAVLSLTANATINNPSGTPVDGQQLMIRMKQDATGGRTVSWGTSYRFSAGTAPTITTTASKTDYVGFQYNGTDSVWDCVAVSQNF